MVEKKPPQMSAAERAVIRMAREARHDEAAWQVRSRGPGHGAPAPAVRSHSNRSKLVPTPGLMRCAGHQAILRPARGGDGKTIPLLAAGQILVWPVRLQEARGPDPLACPSLATNCTNSTPPSSAGLQEDIRLQLARGGWDNPANFELQAKARPLHLNSYIRKRREI